MSDDVVIRAEGLGKKYTIGHEAERESYLALRDVLARQAKTFWRKTLDMSRGRAIVIGDTVEEFWALRDVSFEVKRGEVLGVIGRNGAGKSTLLKVLSRITEPSEGRVTIRGRVASLLEVGTGFHPELTGRENVYLNGAVLGMSRTEIARKFDEIVAFAEIEKFLDTPVKRYSSGMYVRLAFAVAAHLEPEILIVDEVLAVGDAQFQKKCLGKMGEVSREGGRTVLFVSHSMDAILQLTSRVLLFSEGKVLFDGVPDSGVQKYLIKDVNAVGDITFKPRTATRILPFFRRARLIGREGEATTVVGVRDGFALDISYEIPERTKNLELSVRVFSADSRPVFTSMMSESLMNHLSNAEAGIWKATVAIPGNFLMPGKYFITIALHEQVGRVYDRRENVFQITIEDTGTHFTKYNHNHQIGVVMRRMDWACDRVDSIESVGDVA